MPNLETMEPASKPEAEMLDSTPNIINEFKFGTGLLEDTRTEEEKAKDYKMEEVASASPVVWVEKSEAEWRKFPIMNQNSTSSCVAHAIAKCIGVQAFIEDGKYLDLSRRFVYSNRDNKPQEGMHFAQAMEYIRKVGIPLEALVPSENLTEAQMNDNSDIRRYIVRIANIFKTLGYVQMPFDIETIASTIASGKAALLGFTFSRDEWTAFPKILREGTPPLRHAVAGVDYTLYQGKKHILIEDSWGANTAINGRRLINAEFIEKRCIFSGYFLNLEVNTDPTQPKPEHIFTVPMEYGQQSDEIKFLQEVLQYENVMADDIPRTGYYGELTRKGVLAFQQNYQVDTSENLVTLDGKKVGPKTITKLNELYGK